jgi:predicted component of type VI protein secretion system
MSENNPFKFKRSAKLNLKDTQEQKIKSNSITLEPINFDGKIIEITDNDHSIDRSDFSDQDKSISKKDHFQIIQEGNKFILKNNSSNGYCFLQIENQTEVKNGDLLILGAKNKVFKIIIK